MTAYIIADVSVDDPAHYSRYSAMVPGILAKHGGRFLARGGETVALEGGWSPTRIVILEFADLAAAKRFYDSPEYAEARGVRAGAAKLRMIAVAGV
jgi:uncharacterized protein (DUF1330 family)